MTTSVAYVGLNHHHCAPYLDSLAQLPVEVTAACEPDAEIEPTAVGLDPDTPIYPSLDALFEVEQPDVLWVTLSNRDTPDVIRRAAEEGVDVYTEKPAGRRAGEIDDLLPVVEDAGITVGVSYAWRGHPIAGELRERARTGFFGPLQAIDARFVASAAQFRDTDHYLFDPAASRGGILQWLGIHWIDLVPWILDDPIARVSAGTASEAADIDVEDGASLVVELESGAIGTLLAGYYLREGRYDTRIGIYGADGRASWDPMGRTFGFEGETEVELERIADDWSTPRRRHVHEYEPRDGYGGDWGLGFMEQFLAAREGAAPVPADLADTRQVLAVLDAAYEAADTGEWVPVDH